jgi:methionine biosynthesis protein MetW
MSVKTFENHRWESFTQKAEFRHKAAAALVSDGPVLDVGCGDGLLLSMFKEKGVQAEGIDVSDVAVSHCNERGLQAQQGDFANDPLPYADGAFGCVIALDVFEHVYEPESLLKEMVRVSSREIVIGVPNFSSLPARLQVLFGRVPENNEPHKGHIYWFNWNVLHVMVEKNGLHVVACKSNAWGERLPVVGQLSRFLATTFPNLFALSFVIVARKG